MLEIGLYSAIAPLVLLLLSSVWKYPAVLEEVVKWGILRSSIIDSRSWKRSGVIVGLVFGLSEAILFSQNAWIGGQWTAMGMRLFLTVPMHTVSAMIIAFGMKHKMEWLGLGVAMGVHAIFNYFAGLL